MYMDHPFEMMVSRIALIARAGLRNGTLFRGLKERHNSPITRNLLYNLHHIKVDGTIVLK